MLGVLVGTAETRSGLSQRMRCAAGTGGLNVPMFIALRRFTLLCTIVLERVMMAKRHDRSTLGAVAIMIVGARLPRIRSFMHPCLWTCPRLG